MTDDRELCGESTENTDSCENYADTCPWHSTDDPPETGRDFTLSEDDHDDILEAARMGKSERGCARAAGVGWDQLNRYLDAHDEFRGSFARARGTGESVCIQNARSEGGDASFEKFMLAASFDYKKTEKVETEDVGETPDLDDGERTAALDIIRHLQDRYE